MWELFSEKENCLDDYVNERVKYYVVCVVWL